LRFLLLRIWNEENIQKGYLHVKKKRPRITNQIKHALPGYPVVEFRKLCLEKRVKTSPTKSEDGLSI
jgi:hypothetical protein